MPRARARTAWAGLCGALLFCVPASALAAQASDAEKCAAAKVAAAGLAIYGQAVCVYKSLVVGTAVDPECLSKAETKLTSSYTKAEDHGGCNVSNDADDTQAIVDACATALTAAPTGEPTCAAAKVKAAGKDVSSQAKCWRRGYGASESADAACLARADSALAKAVVKADGKGVCSATTSDLDVLVDGCVSDLVGATDPSACALAVNTAATATVSPDGCYVLDRDTTACQADRSAHGLSGFWLEFSCRVTLSVGGGNDIVAQADGQPDHRSNYFAATSTCHETYTGGIQNPNLISPKSYTITFPASPNTLATAMAGGAVGLAVNGVPIFGDFAAPGDDIFAEAQGFDRCGAHPTMSGQYHYHGEPYAISYDDSRFIGVMRDGHPIYGRRDSDNSLPSLDSRGGHTGNTIHGVRYHYHLNEQTNPLNPAESQWFLTTGQYRGSPGSCSGC